MKQEVHPNNLFCPHILDNFFGGTVSENKCFALEYTANKIQHISEKSMNSAKQFRPG